MGKYVIDGGIKLEGRVSIESSKNAVLPMLAAAILTDDEVVIHRCPKIQDVLNMIKILEVLGVNTRFEDNSLIINSKGMNSYSIPYSLGKELRSSIFMMGALVSRFKKAILSYPGGCDIGLRPVDMHLKALKELGVFVDESGGEITCRTDKVKGKAVYLDFPSVGATENAMLVAVTGEGKTEIRNAAKEPEIVDLMNFLNSMGAKVYGAGTSTILIDGVKRLHGTEFKPMSDRIETGTYMIAAAITGGEVEIFGCETKNISSLIHKLCDNTCKVSAKNDIIHIKSNSMRKCFSLETGPYPCFPTDLQAQAVALATVSEGTSVITENVFEMRFKHVPELVRMGADITVKGRTAIIKGSKRLYGAEISAKDLRGGAALVLAALVAEGRSFVSGVNHIERGYLDMDGKLRGLGARINKI